MARLIAIPSRPPVTVTAKASITNWFRMSTCRDQELLDAPAEDLTLRCSLPGPVHGSPP